MSGSAGYGDWLYDTDELFDASIQGFFSVDVAAYRDRKGALPDDITDQVEEATDEATDMDVEEFERVTGLSAYDAGKPDEYGDEQSVNAVVASGSFDADDITDQIEDESELSENGEYEGYTLYTRRPRWDPSRTNAAAVTDGTVVGATADAKDREEEGDDGYSRGTPTGTPSEPPRNGVTAEASVKRTIDANNGNAPSLTDGDGVLPEAMSDVSGQPMVGAAAISGEEIRQDTGLGEESSDEENDVASGVRDLTTDLVGIAGSATAEDESGDVTIRLYYEDDSAVGDRADTVEDLKADLEEQSEAVTVPDVDVTTEGRSVVVTITGDPSEFYDELMASSGGRSGGRETTRAPQVAFSFDFESAAGDSSGELTITHDGGDTVTANQLRIVAEDGTPDQLWGSSGDVSAGSSVTVEADSSDTIRLVWQSAEGGTSATLGRWTGPDA